MISTEPGVILLHTSARPRCDAREDGRAGSKVVSATVSEGDVWVATLIDPPAT
jgi:hypothetical protein